MSLPLFERGAFTVIAGPCVIEDQGLCLEVAQHMRDVCADLGVSYVFKASFDKANRTSLASFRGPGLHDGLKVLAHVKEQVGVPVLTDVHEPSQVEDVAKVVDMLQIPAFLCRQTDLIAAAARSGVPCNIKKGQFLAPEDMRHPVAKFRDSGGKNIAVTERGSSFGYHNLVVDMRSLVTMREATDCPVIFDATHSVQRPSAGDGVTSGDRRMAPVLARAAAAVGMDGLFCEVHPNPPAAKSDAANTIFLKDVSDMLKTVVAIRSAAGEVSA